MSAGERRFAVYVIAVGGIAAAAAALLVASVRDGSLPGIAAGSTIAVVTLIGVAALARVVAASERGRQRR